MDEHLTEQELQEIEARAEAATEGPWAISKGRETVYATKLPADADPDSRVIVADCMMHNNGRRFEDDYVCAQWDAAFIAASRTDIPALLKEVRRLQAKEQSIAVEIYANNPQYCLCPVCGRLYWKKSYTGTYCDYCGQRLLLPTSPEGGAG